MMLKKPSLFLFTYGGLHSSCAINPSSTVSSTPRYTTRNNVQHPARRKPQFRNYADVASDCHPSGRPEDLQWPESPSATRIPTPYQIFGLKRKAPYSKKRFYELVKLYHPDRNAHPDGSSTQDSLSEAIKLERYRLVVAANNILSDPARRAAYDRFGVGWNGQPDCGSSKAHDWAHSEQKWSGFDHNSSPHRNATWEDWEKWYQREATHKDYAKTGKRVKPQSPVFFSNGGFLSLVVMVAALAGIGQANRVGDYSQSFLERIEGVHDDCSKELQRRRNESIGFDRKDDRIQNFLRTRDPVGYGVTDPREEGLRKMLPAPETCMSGVIQDRGSARGS